MFHLYSLEVANALRYIDGLVAEDVAKAIDAFKSLGLRVVSDLELLGDAVRIAFENDITVYDSIYLALARRVGGVLITYDRKLLSKGGEVVMKASTFLARFVTR